MIIKDIILRTIPKLTETSGFRSFGVSDHIGLRAYNPKPTPKAGEFKKPAPYALDAELKEASRRAAYAAPGSSTEQKTIGCIKRT